MMAVLVSLFVGETTRADELAVATTITSLDGPWSLATDPDNMGREQKWFEKQSLDGAKPARVPWIIQATFPGYHGVVWYARDFVAPARPQPGARCLLRFWQVDYLAEVWLNGQPVGGHEGGETPFVLDVTAAVRPGVKNRLVVRVLNPAREPIDGISLYQTARRCKTDPFRAGAIFNHGGITESVELLWTPEVRLDDLFVLATPVGIRNAGPLTPGPSPARGEGSSSKGRVELRAVVHNAGPQAHPGCVEFTVASARSGETVAAVRVARQFAPGNTAVEAQVSLGDPHLWDLADPYLYRATARVAIDGAGNFDERSTRFGFRDFRFTDGYFRLNGRRIYLRSSHTCNHYPLGIQFPDDPELLRRDMINMKAMGFNMIRFIWGGASRVQLDLCDEIGLMVYEESYASMPIGVTPDMPRRFDAAVSELICRDRNHPSIVAWGLLNETNDGPTFRHAAGMLPLARGLDPSRMVLLNSGRWDERPYHGLGAMPGLHLWLKDRAGEPWVGRNVSRETVRTLGITWPAGHLALHPGPANEPSIVRWTAPAAGPVDVAGAFVSLAGRATTDVHLRHNRRAVWDGFVNLRGAGQQTQFAKTLTVARGDTLEFVVGTGNGNYGGDTTGLRATVRAGGKTHDATTEFSATANPNAAWSYGYQPADAAQFTPYPPFYAKPAGPGLGSLSNPGSLAWDGMVRDIHTYPRVPHTATTIEKLKTMDGEGQPVFLTEYGIGSAVDLWRATRHFEQHGAEGLEDAEFFRQKLDQFLADWRQWHLDEAFARPEDFFMESLKKMAGQRTLGLNAIRANPNIVSHSLTGAIDHVMTGEGLTTLFRELKPGTIDALYDAWAPLRWCLFAEPAHAARGATVHVEAVLANEDALKPGDYPARFQVIGPNLTRVLDRTLTVTISPPNGKAEPPLARPCFAADVKLDGPPGRYQFLATFERGAAPAGRPAEFYVTDPAEMPRVETEVTLWGEDPKLAKWLGERGIRTRPYSPRPSAPGGPQFNSPRPLAGEGPGVRGVSFAPRSVILATTKPPAPGGREVFAELARRVATGSTVVFLCPEVFVGDAGPTAWLPLAQKGTRASIRGWLYLKDEWAKQHPMFDGLPAGGLMDYTYYRELIPDDVWQGQPAPAEAVAGAIKASQDYASGLMLAVHTLGAGRMVLNTLKIRENLDTHPAAERLLRNMLRYAARDVAQRPVALPADFGRQLQAMGLGKP
jgi:hypothetical protein